MKRKYWLYLSLGLVGCAALILGLETNGTNAASETIAMAETGTPPKVTKQQDLMLQPKGGDQSLLNINTLQEPSMVEIDLTNVALRHQVALQYPPYSQPITDSNSPYLDWNKFEEVSIPVLDGEASASLRLNKYRHFYPDQIDVKLNTNSSVLSAELEIINVETMKVIDVQSQDSGQWIISPSKDWPEEIRFVANVEFEQGDDIVSADIRFYHSVASILAVEEGYADGADLRIPVILETEQEGTFRVRANLYDSHGGAIASLVTKQRLPIGQQTIELKAFKSVLPKGQSELHLKDIMIERMSGYPGQKAGYGQSNVDSYSIGNFDSNTLSDQGYEMSEQEKSQIEFLKQVI